MPRLVPATIAVLAVTTTAAEAERRIGVDGGFAIGDDLVGPEVGLAGSVPVGPVSLRARLGYGKRAYRDGPRDESDPNEMKKATLWGASVGVETRSDFAGDGSVGGYASAEAGLCRLAGGFLTDETTFRGLVLGQFGVELRSEHARFRVGIGLGASVGRRVAALRDSVDPFPVGRLGIEVAF